MKRKLLRRSPITLSLLLTLAVALSCFAFFALTPASRSWKLFENEPRQEFEEDAEKKLDWFYFQRTYPSGVIPEKARLNAWNRRPATNAPLSLGWTPLGPAPTNSDIVNWGNTSGRINSIAVSPANPNLVLVGGSTGGIWRSTDGGATFTSVSDNQVDLAVGSIAFAPSDPTIVYAGMGDSHGSYLGTGVLKSTDSGQTWTRVSDNTLPAPGLIATVTVSPADPNLVFVAQYVSQAGNFSAASGFYRSTNGGVTWTNTLAGLARDVVVRPNNPATLYLAMQRTDQDALPAGVFRSTNSGVTWTNIYTSPFDANRTSNIKVAVTPANDNFIYVYTGGNIGSTFSTRVEVSTNAGGSFTNRGNAGLDTGQFTYNNYLYASPADANTIYVGTRDVFKSTNGGVSFTNLTNNFDAVGGYNPDNSNAHPDQHSLAFTPGNANTIYIGNDGGLYKSTDGGTNFTSSNNGLSLTQFVGYALHPTDPLRSYGGMQDNGSQKRLTNGTPAAWREFVSGDGGRVVINPLAPTEVFSTYIYGSITRWLNNADTRDTNVATNATFGEPADGARIAFYPPFTGNRVDSTLYFGTWRLFISTNRGDTWTAPGGMTDLTTGTNDVLSAIGVSRSNPNVIYTGSTFGAAMVSTNGGANWANITTGLPDRSITSITVSPTNPAQAYLTVSGFNTGHIFLTTNTGANWTDISNNLPDVPVNALLIDPLNPNTLYAGTDIGVYRSLNGGTAWNTFNNGLPPVIVTAFDAQASGRIQLATYGRGAYELGNIAGCPAVTGIAPATGAIGSVVTINGTDFTGVTTVKFSGNVNAVAPIITDTQITAIVPPGAITGPITISKAACADAMTTAYTVTGTCPTITIAGTLPNGSVGMAYPTTTLTASGDGAAYTFSVSAGTLPPGLQLQPGLPNTATVSGTPTAQGQFTFTIRATDNLSNCVSDQQYTVMIGGNGLQFYPLPSPVRLLDTRASATVGCVKNTGPFANNETRTQTARTTCSTVPANATAIVGNITVVPTGPGFLTLFPSDAAQPTVANSNFKAGEVTNNFFTVGLGAADGAFKIFTSLFTGGTNSEIIIDVTGYYAPPGTGGLYYHALPAPVRLLQTFPGQTGCILNGSQQLQGTNDANANPALDLAVQGRGNTLPSPCNGIPSDAVVLVGNATTVFPNAPFGFGYLTIYPSDAARPTVASSNYGNGDIINGPFAVKLGADGKFKVYTFSTTHLVIDISGYYSTSANDANGAGLLFNPLPKPMRLLETRNIPGFPLVGCYQPKAPISGGTGGIRTQQAWGACADQPPLAIPNTARALVGNVSVINPVNAGFGTFFPGDVGTAPTVATTNYPFPVVFGYNRHYYVGLSPADGTFKILTQFTSDYIVDVSGYFAP